jgi:O-acetyl-ADP-ribose deacetylase (regulator of RNase III)
MRKSVGRKMQLIFRDLNAAVVEAIREAFKDVVEVTAVCAPIFIPPLKAGAILSPANCRGYMTGGIDKVYVEQLDSFLQARLRSCLGHAWNGYLPIGQAVVINTHRKDIPYLISAPTMDWPPGDVSTTNHAYLAFRAALTLCRNIGIQSLLTPGLCTGTGRMAPHDSAHQMRQAWDEVFNSV